MKTIYKYPLQVTDDQDLFLPKGAVILSVIVQQNVLVLYAGVDNSEKIEERRKIKIFGTGNPVYYEQGKLRFIASVQQGVFVWHVFENININEEV